VDFALCVVRRGAGPVFDADPLENPDVLACSGWRTIPPDAASHEMMLELPRATTEVADLHFATRMNGGRPNAWAWADWRRVSLRVWS
jgi:hypothetical protein